MAKTKILIEIGERRILLKIGLWLAIKHLHQPLFLPNNGAETVQVRNTLQKIKHSFSLSSYCRESRKVYHSHQSPPTPPRLVVLVPRAVA